MSNNVPPSSIFVPHPPTPPHAFRISNYTFTKRISNAHNKLTPSVHLHASFLVHLPMFHLSSVSPHIRVQRHTKYEIAPILTSSPLAPCPSHPTAFNNIAIQYALVGNLPPVSEHSFWELPPTSERILGA